MPAAVGGPLGRVGCHDIWYRPMNRISAFSSASLLVVVTLFALPLQMLANRMRWPLGRHLPVWWHRFALARLGARVVEVGSPANDRPLLLTANHASWLDIPVLASRMPLSFVAKSEGELSWRCHSEKNVIVARVWGGGGGGRGRG